MKLYSAWYCPFAQRSWVALEYLGVPYQYLEIDPYEKTPSWMDISRGTGQVPVVEVSGTTGDPVRIPDSLRALEYLADAYAHHKALLPKDALARGDALYWADYQSRAIIPYFYRFLKAQNGEDGATTAKSHMLDGLTVWTGAMNQDGPYFLGQEPGLIDFAFAPFALRIELLLSHYKDFALPITGNIWARYATWWRAMKSHPALLNTMQERSTYDARLTEFYLPYSEGGGQEDVTNVA